MLQGLPTRGHRWQDDQDWGYTQTTDVEIETYGRMTYDRPCRRSPVEREVDEVCLVRRHEPAS